MPLLRLLFSFLLFSRELLHTDWWRVGGGGEENPAPKECVCYLPRWMLECECPTEMAGATEYVVESLAGLRARLSI